MSKKKLRFKEYFFFLNQVIVNDQKSSKYIFNLLFSLIGVSFGSIY